MRLIIFQLILILLLISGLGCNNNGPSPVESDTPPQLVKSPGGDNSFPSGLEPTSLPPSNYYKDEATDLSAWWSGELYAPEDLRHEIATELRRIRLGYAKTVPNSQIRFRSVDATGQLLFGFSNAGWEMWKDGTYDAWDSLNIALNVDSIVVTTHYPEDFKYVVLFFNGRPNVSKLIELYSGLPETKYVEGNMFCCDWPILLMWRQDDIVHYFFRNAWGDCPSGCIYEDYYYFTVVDGEATYIGYYEHDWDRPMPRPDWMAIADLASDKYWPY